MAREIIPPGPLQLPYRAVTLYPSHTAVDVPQDAVLHWMAGNKAAQHEVYFSADQEAVANGTAPVTRLGKAQTSFDPGTLERNKTYYWRVDEVNATATDGPWPGNVWSFTTADFVMVEDFDSYNNTDNCIFDTWIDGVANKSSGSRVGYENSPFAEWIVVQSGSQSMPLAYDNTAAPFYSEAERQWTTARDWTVAGGDTLVLFIRGKSLNNASQPLYVGLTDKAGKSAFAKSDPAILKAVTWTEWRIPLSQFGVNAAAIKKMVIGVGNRDQPTAGGTGLVYLDTIKVISSAGK